MLTARADVIGSLLRPRFLLDAKRAFEEDRIQRDELEARGRKLPMVVRDNHW